MPWTPIRVVRFVRRWLYVSFVGTAKLGRPAKGQGAGGDGLRECDMGLAIGGTCAAS